MTEAWSLLVLTLVVLGIWRLTNDGVEFGVVVLGLMLIVGILLTTLPWPFF